MITASSSTSTRAAAAPAGCPASTSARLSFGPPIDEVRRGLDRLAELISEAS